MRNLKVRIQLHDLLFFLLLVFSLYFTRNMMCRLMMVLFFAYTVFRQITTKHRMPIPFFYVGFLAFILYGGLNVLMGNVIDADVARTMVISLFLNLLMIYAIVQYIYMQDDIQKTLRIAELGIFTTAVVVVLLSLKTITSGRLGGGTEMNSNVLAILSVYGFILCMYLRKVGNLTTQSFWARVAFYSITVLLTGSRKGLFMIFLAIIIVSFFNYKKKVLKIVVIAMVAAVATYFVIMNVGFLYDIIGVRVENLLLYFTKGTVTEGSLLSRLELANIAKPYIEKKPWTGYGFDCFKTISGVGGDGKVGLGDLGYYSHNNYIELLFGGGIIGFVLYYIPVAHLLKKLFGKTKVDKCIPYLIALLVSKLAVEYAYVSYYERVDAYIVAVILGCVLICKKSADAKAEPN